MAEAATRTTQPRGDATRERILDVATRLMAKNGSRGTSLKRVAAEVGVSPSALFHHFPTKEALLFAVIERQAAIQDGLLWRYNPDPGLTLFANIADMVRQWKSRPELVGLVTIMVAENAGEAAPHRESLARIYQDTVQRIRRTFEAAQQRGEMRTDVDARLKAIEMLAFISGLENACLINPDIPAEATAAAWAEQQSQILRR